MIITTKSASGTVIFGRKVAKKLHGGEILALIGPLGSGKTSFAKGVAAGLGVRRLVPSPTFVLMNLYPLRPRRRDASPLRLRGVRYLCHIDAYRLKTAHELEEVGAREFLGRPDTVCVIEWADKLSAVLRHFVRNEYRFTAKSVRTRTIAVRLVRPVHKKKRSR